MLLVLVVEGCVEQRGAPVYTPATAHVTAERHNRTGTRARLAWWRGHGDRSPTDPADRAPLTPLALGGWPHINITARREGNGTERNQENENTAKKQKHTES